MIIYVLILLILHKYLLYVVNVSLVYNYMESFGGDWYNIIIKSEQRTAMSKQKSDWQDILSDQIIVIMCTERRRPVCCNIHTTCICVPRQHFYKYKVL